MAIGAHSNILVKIIFKMHLIGWKIISNISDSKNRDNK